MPLTINYGGPRHLPTAYEEEEETMLQKQYQRVFGDEYNQESLLNKTASRELLMRRLFRVGVEKE